MSELTITSLLILVLFGFLLLDAAPHPAPQNTNIIDQFNPANFPFANQIPFLQQNNNTSTTNGTSSSGIPFMPEGMAQYIPGGVPNMANIPFANVVAGGGNTNIPFGDLLGGNTQWQNFFGGIGSTGSGRNE